MCCFCVASIHGPSFAANTAVNAADISETIKEVLFSLDASYVEKLPQSRYLQAALRCVQASAPCVVVDAGNAWQLQCEGRTVEVNKAASGPKQSWSSIMRMLAVAAPEPKAQGVLAQEVAHALAASVDDPFTAYLSPRFMAEAALQNGQGAASPAIEVWPRDPSLVRDVRFGSDAFQQGLRAGDRIVRVGGDSTQGLNYVEVLQKLSGANQTGVKLGVRKKAQTATVDVVVMRTLVPEKEVMHQLLGRVLYLSVPLFKSGMSQVVSQTVSAANAEAIILDLRHNPGGLVEEAVAMLDVFLRSGPMAGVRSGPARPTEDFVAHNDAFDVSVPMVVLVDSASASASELSAMVLQERGRARILGHQTAGKGSVQRQIPTPEGGLLKVTAGYYVGPSGHRLDDKGVQPQRFLAANTSASVLEGADPMRDSWVLSALDELQRPNQDRTHISTQLRTPGPMP